MDVTKEYINQCKSSNSQKLLSLFRTREDNKEMLFVLQNLGRLPDNFDEKSILPFILPLVSNKNQAIRLWAIKTLGKTRSRKNLSTLEKVAINDDSTEVRREAVSSIGRLRDASALPVLLNLVTHSDPKIVLQAIRGLLVFKHKAEVAQKLKSLLQHPNEMIQSVIEKEFYPKESKKSTTPHHQKTHDFLKNKIILGDVRKVLELVPDESFHLSFTSPPYYNARDYSIYRSYQEYLNFLEDVFYLVYKKTKEGRFFIVNTSPIIIPRVSRQHSSKRYPIPFDIHNFLVKMDWEFIDDIVWEKPESSVKNRNAGFFQHRKPLAYKPNAVTEYLMVYRKKTDKLIDWNIRQYDSLTVEQSKVKNGYETSNIWKIDPQCDKVHSAVFPAQLCKRVIAYYSFVGDLVFDPFAGSGTFGRVAKSLNRYFFLTEKERKYFDYMKSFLSEGHLFKNEKFRSDFLSLSEYKKVIADDHNRASC